MRKTQKQGNSSIMKSLNILVYRNSVLPISETFVYNQSINLRRYEAYLLGSNHPRGAQIELPAGFSKVINPGNLYGKFKELIFKLFGIITEDTYRWIMEKKPVLIHAHSGYDGAVVLPLAKKLGIPLIVTFIGSDASIKDDFIKHSYLHRRVYFTRRLELIKEAVKIIVPSEFLKQKLLEKNFPENKLIILHHGIDLKKFPPNKSYPIYGNIVFVGRLTPQKGLSYLISAINRLMQEFPMIHLSVIGDGPSRQEYEKFARAEIPGKYDFLGAQTSEIVSEYLSRAYIFSMPSVSMTTGETESFGLVFVEAQAMGVPVVSFKSGGIPEVVADGETGLLCSERDIDALSYNIRRLLIDRQLHDQMSVAAIRRVHDLFNLDKQNKLLEDLYDSILNYRTDQMSLK